MLVVLCVCLTFAPGAYADPPPHAPAHGYRYKHDQGVELVFDTGLGVYIGVDLPDIFFSSPYFYKKDKNGWKSSKTYSGSWISIGEDSLPPGLRGNKQKGNPNGGAKNKQKGNKKK